MRKPNKTFYGGIELFSNTNIASYRDFYHKVLQL